MKKIICLGDSNTFGFNPKDAGRFCPKTRWTGVLSGILGDGFKIVEEGCNNRTAFFISPDGDLQSGQKYLPQCLEKHGNFDIFIYSLGTNDLQKIFPFDKTIAEQGLKNTIFAIRKTSPNARIILISPVAISEGILKGYFSHQFDENSIKNSILLQKIYEETAQNEMCEYLDINKHVSPCECDYLHFDAASHKIIAEIAAKQILKTDNLESHTTVRANG